MATTTKKTTEKATEKTKTTGELIMAYLKKHPATTTEKLAEVTGVPYKDVFSRCWWLSAKDGLLKSKGKGKTREWSLNARGIKSLNPPPPAV